MKLYIFLYFINYFLCQLTHKKHFLSILSIFKNEAQIFPEWIQHHITEGIEHFYLLDNGSTDNYYEKLQKYIDQGIVTIKHNSTNLQSLLMYEYFKEITNKTEWVLLLDLDEFAYASDKNETIKTILQKQYLFTCENPNLPVGTIYVPWKTFGSSFYKEQPELLIPNMMLSHDCSKTFCSHKTLTKTDAFVETPLDDLKITSTIGVHVFLIDFNNFCVIDSPDLLYINHYKIQSEEFWVKNKMSKGYLLPPFHLDFEMFQKFDVNDYIDYGLVQKKMDLGLFFRLKEYCISENFQEIKEINGKFICSCQKSYLQINGKCVHRKIIEISKDNDRDLKIFNNIYSCPCKKGFRDVGFDSIYN